MALNHSAHRGVVAREQTHQTPEGDQRVVVDDGQPFEGTGILERMKRKEKNCVGSRDPLGGFIRRYGDTGEEKTRGITDSEDHLKQIF